MTRVREYYHKYQKEKEKFEDQIGQLQDRISELEEEKKILMEEKETLGMMVKDLETDVREEAMKNKRLDSSIRMNQTISENLEEVKQEVEYWKEQCRLTEEKYKREYNKLQSVYKEKLEKQIVNIFDIEF
jgi:chromosome segregation ATPase